MQVAFGPGAASASESSSIRTYGVPKIGNSSRKNDNEPESAEDEELISPLPMDFEEYGKNLNEKTEDAIKNTKDYKEPWVISLSPSHFWRAHTQISVLIS